MSSPFRLFFTSFFLALSALCFDATQALKLEEDYLEFENTHDHTYGLTKEALDGVIYEQRMGRLKAVASLPGLTIFETFALPITAGRAGVRALRRGFLKIKGYKTHEDSEDEDNDCEE